MSLSSAVGQWMDAVASLAWPRLCPVCGDTLVRGERPLCLACETAMPLLHIDPSAGSPLLRRIPGRVPVRGVAALMPYAHDTPWGRMVLQGKFSGRDDLLRWLAGRLAGRLADADFCRGIDAVVPVPMHPLKHLKRGYNQCDIIAEEIGTVCHLPLCEVLATGRHRAQKRLSRKERLRPGRPSPYRLYPDADIRGRHLLLVDDILTTGATVADCADTLLRAGAAAVSVAVIGLTAEG